MATAMVKSFIFNLFFCIFVSYAFAGNETENQLEKDPEVQALLCKVLIGALVSPHLQFAEHFTVFKGPEFYKALVKLYPDIAWLRYKVVGSPEDGGAAADPESPSVLVFGKKASEFDRAAVGIRLIQQVLAGDYEGVTENQKVAAIKLKPESFQEWRALSLRVLNSPEAIDAMLAYLSMHDLGKVKTFSRIVEGITLKLDPDHDRVLVEGLKALGDEPIISPSYDRLSPHYRDLIMRGLLADFNMGQFAQAENVPASLLSLKGLDKEAFDFYLVHLLFDVAGAGGAKNPNGSSVMIEPVYNGFRMGAQILPKLFEGMGAKQVYDAFLKNRADVLGLPMNNLQDRAIVRLALLSRATNPTAATEVVTAFNSLPEVVRKILEKELNVSGIDDGFAILPYYAPATFAETKGALNAQKDPESNQKSLRIVMNLLAQMFQEGRAIVKGRQGNGIFTINMEQMTRALKDSKVLNNVENYTVELKAFGNDASASLSLKTGMSADAFPKLKSLSELPGAKIVPIGIGGGSDVIQAAQLGLLLRSSGKTVPAVISIRTEKPGSADPSGKIPESRSVQSHGGEIAPGVFKILPHSTGSGRFLENIPASEIPVYLVIDRQDGKLADQIQAVAQEVGNPDTFIAVDTGGDALYSATKTGNSPKTTPDQDLRVLKTLPVLMGRRILTAEIAVGIDSPENAEEVLRRSEAKYFEPTREQASEILKRYADWKMDGTDKSRFGKTQLAWAAALSGKQGTQALPIPDTYVLDSKNPWIPFVHISPSMKGIFFMDLEKHQSAISSESASR